MSNDQIKMVIVGLIMCSALALLVSANLSGRIPNARAAGTAGEIDLHSWSVSSSEFPSSLVVRPGDEKTMGRDSAARPQDGQQEKTAEETYKNIQIFKGIPASRIMGAMQFFTRSLGVDCAYCHVQGEFEKDDKPQKKTARIMYQMVRLASSEISSNKVSCYMCHRGHSKPEPQPQTEAEKAKLAGMIKKAQEDTRPAGEAFKNIQYLKGVPAGMFMVVMDRWAEMLGVDCTHCHVQDQSGNYQYDKDDKPAKQTALKMARMIGAITKDLYKLPTPINCYLCHKGQVTPVAFPPAEQK